MQTGAAGWPTYQTLLVIAVGLAYSLGVILKWGPLNGIPEMSNWEWPWRSLGIPRTAITLLPPFLAIAWAIWRIETVGARVSTKLLLGVLTLSNFGLQVLGVLADGRGFNVFRKVVASPKATSYFTDALAIQRVPEWLGMFHRLQLHNHAATHPPGAILFYYVFIQLFGSANGAWLGGLAVGLAGSLGVLTVYSFSELWTPDQRTRLLSSALYALLPALIVFLPEFDQIYPIFAMLMILCWVKALTPSPTHALCLGAVLFTSIFFAYNLLLMGTFLGFYGLYWLWREGGTAAAYKTLAGASAIALGVWGSCYGVLWAATRYNPVASLRSALANQARFAAYLDRSHLRCAIYDPYDFAMGAGIIAVLIVLFYLLRNSTAFDFRRTDLALTVIGLATILTIDLSGLLRAETARVWLFLQPLLIVPAALELARLRRVWLLALLALQWWIVVCLKARMSFIWL